MKKVLRVIAAAAILAVGVCFMALITNGADKANTDYVCYWSAGQQLVHRQNPYDRTAILRIERTGGLNSDRPTFMRNPPTAFFLALPLGFFRERTGAIVWSLMIIGTLMGSIRLLWIMHGKPSDGIHLIGYCFPPVLACLIGGQVATFILFGVVLFLYLHERYPFASGAVLLMCALKPHLFLPFGIVLLVWAAARRNYRLVAGAVTSLACSFAFSFYLDPHGWSHYGEMLKSEQLANELIPTASLMFRLAVDRHAVWIQFVPAAAACIWALGYFWKNRDRWSWREQGLLLLVVSVSVAPYAWFSDEAVVLPAILAGLYHAAKYQRSLLPFALVAGVAFLEVMVGIQPYSGFYVWTAPAWLLWYLYTTRSSRAEVQYDNSLAENPSITVENA